MNPKRLSIIIIDYKSKNLLPKCLSKIKENVDTFHEVIVVDNNEINRGFAKGANLGAQKAKGDYLLFLNPDCLINSGDFSKLLVYLDHHQTIGVVGLKMILKDGSIQPYSFGWKYSLKTSILSKFLKDKSLGKTKPDWFSGGALFIRKDLFNSLLGFDERFFMYFEDQDFCLRAKDKGYQVESYPEIIVTHLGGIPASGGAYSDVDNQQNLYYESQNKFIKKYYGEVYALFFGFFRRFWLAMSILRR